MIGAYDLLIVTIARWLGLVALATIMGSLVLDLFVLPRDSEPFVAARRRLRRWGAAAVAVLTVATAGELIARAHTMSGGNLAEALAALPIVLTRTHFGAIWTARAAALGLLLAVSLVRARPARIVGLLLALGIALTTSLTGHAADWGDRSLAVLVDWVHAVAAGVWTGGLFGLALTVIWHRASWRPEVLGVVARRFSGLAGGCLLAVVATGTYNSWIQVPTLAVLWTTAYGRALALKLVLALALLLLGAANRYLILPEFRGKGRPGRIERWFRLGRLAVFGPHTGQRPPVARLARFVSCEALIAVAVLGCTAVLGETTPKSHAGHAARSAHMEATLFRVGMDELHASGGVPKGWLFTPPPGDAARGRAVFGRLECFACHAVAGERFPRPSSPGPALTGVGDHHPASYLLESIVNPNAVIVEAPGYSGPDGRSTMPDYQDRLSASELIDLVAYLKSLGG